MNPLVTYANHDGVAVIAVDNPPVNALSPGVPEGLEVALDRAAADSQVRAMVITGAGRTLLRAPISASFKIWLGARGPAVQCCMTCSPRSKIQPSRW
jgi:hypothetical protein